MKIHVSGAEEPEIIQRVYTHHVDRIVERDEIRVGNVMGVLAFSPNKVDTAKVL